MGLQKNPHTCSKKLYHTDDDAIRSGFFFRHLPKKLKSKKTQTQGKFLKNARNFCPKTQETETPNFSSNLANFGPKILKFSRNSRIFLNSSPKSVKNSRNRQLYYPSMPKKRRKKKPVSRLLPGSTRHFTTDRNFSLSHLLNIFGSEMVAHGLKIS